LESPVSFISSPNFMTNPSMLGIRMRTPKTIVIVHAMERSLGLELPMTAVDDGFVTGLFSASLFVILDLIE